MEKAARAKEKSNRKVIAQTASLPRKGHSNIAMHTAHSTLTLTLRKSANLWLGIKIGLLRLCATPRNPKTPLEVAQKSLLNEGHGR